MRKLLVLSLLLVAGGVSAQTASFDSTGIDVSSFGNTVNLGTGGVDVGSATGGSVNLSGSGIDISKTGTADLGLPTSVSGLNLNPDGSVNVDSATNVKINNTSVSGSGLKLNADGSVSADSVNVKTNSGQVGVKIDQPVSVSADGVVSSPVGTVLKIQIETPTAGTQTIEAVSIRDGVKATIDGQEVMISAKDGGLGVQINTLNETEGQLVVGLPGNTINLIKNDDDLRAYVSLVAKTRPNVRDVAITDNGIEITYNQPAKFFGLFKSSLNARAIVASDGKVEIDLPWYSFLYSKNSSAVKSSIQTSIGSGGIQVSGSTNSESSAQGNAKAVNVVSASINNTVSVSSGGNSVNLGSDGINVNR